MEVVVLQVQDMEVEAATQALLPRKVHVGLLLEEGSAVLSLAASVGGEG